MTDVDLLKDRRDKLAVIRAERLGYAEWEPWTDAQTAPDGDWYGWLFLAGRGTGKTDAGSNYVVEHVKGPACIEGPQPHRIAIIAPTLGDAREACVEGETGIKRHDFSARMWGQSEVRWPNGSVAQLFGTYTKQDVERLRAGGNRCLAWLEELAAWPQLQKAYEQMQFGLRSGSNPHWIATTTGKPRRLLKDLLKDSKVKITTAETQDNPHLPDHIRQALIDRYGGTRLGEQELKGKIAEDVEGAIWTVDEIEPDRVNHPPQVEDEAGEKIINLDAVVVPIDPPGGATECGIVAVGRKRLPDGLDHFYVLADRSLKASPNEWAKTAIQLYRETEADAIVGETNYGGDMVKTIIGNNVESGIVPVKEVRATRGKRVRAEPVHDLYEQHRVHHVGRFEQLEEEMTTWVPEDSPEPAPGEENDAGDADKSKWSPNRLDALVWGITYLAAFNEPRIWFA